MSFDAYIFDLDGTLLDTLADLHATANHALEVEGFPPRTLAEIKTFVGNGALALMWRAVPEGTPQEIVDHAYQVFTDSYEEYGMSLATAYEGIEDVLAELKARGKKIGVVSNKFDRGVKLVVEKHLPDYVDFALGESPTTPRKPDPTGLLHCAEVLGVAPERCAYFGDSASDMRAAHNAGMYAVGVTWGFPTLEQLNEGNPDRLVDTTCEILDLEIPDLEK